MVDEAANERALSIPREERRYGFLPQSRKVDIRLPGKGNSNPHGTRPVYSNHLDD